MTFTALALLASLAATGPVLRFEITDARGKKASGVRIEAGDPDPSGWCALMLTKGHGDAVLVWPFDSMAKAADGPEPIPAIVIQKGDERALGTARVVAAMAASIALEASSTVQMAQKSGFSAAMLARAFSELVSAKDSFDRGVGLLLSKNPADAVDDLGRALKDRQRQLTRTPSEIYPAAMLYGTALMSTGKFDEAAVAFAAALSVRAADPAAVKARNNALIKAGKPEAAGQSRP